MSLNRRDFLKILGIGTVGTAAISTKYVPIVNSKVCNLLQSISFLEKPWNGVRERHECEVMYNFINSYNNLYTNGEVGNTIFLYPEGVAIDGLQHYSPNGNKTAAKIPQTWRDNKRREFSEKYDIPENEIYSPISSTSGLIIGEQKTFTKKNLKI